MSFIFCEVDTVFRQSKKTARWWMQPNKTYIACSYQTTSWRAAMKYRKMDAGTGAATFARLCVIAVNVLNQKALYIISFTFSIHTPITMILSPGLRL
jgi:hypothetical protein